MKNKYYLYHPNTTLYGIIVIIIITAWACTLTSCANQMAPTGGAKDTLAPKLLLSIPKNGSVNYQGKKVILLFNEWVKTDNLEKELLITPNIKKYKLKEGKNRIELTLIDSLRKNTTYNFNFRESIKDISEKNVASNINIAFSTGGILDTLQISGNLTELFTGKSIKDAVVSLYPAFDTLRIDKHKPFYYTLSDKSGSYTLKNIKAGAYQIYALKDQNNNGFYDEGELIGFLENTLQLDTANLNNINFKLSKEDYTPAKYIGQSAIDSLVCEVNFSEGLLRAYPDSGVANLPYLYEIKAPEGNTLVLYKTDATLNDSLKINFVVYDSLNNRTAFERKVLFANNAKDKDKNKPTKKKNDTEKPMPPPKVIIQTKLLSNEGIENDELHWQLSFNQPIIQFDKEKIRYSIDKDTIQNNILLPNNKDFVWNTAKTLLTIKQKINIKDKITIAFDSTTFKGIRDNFCQPLKQSYTLKDADKYGNILGEVKTEQKNYVIQLLDNNFKVVAQQVNSPKFSFGFLKAGGYFLRILIDKNANGTFEQGNYRLRRLPEDMSVYKVTPDVREKWDIKSDIIF